MDLKKKAAQIVREPRRATATTRVTEPGGGDQAEQHLEHRVFLGGKETSVPAEAAATAGAALSVQTAFFRGISSDEKMGAGGVACLRGENTEFSTLGVLVFFFLCGSKFCRVVTRGEGGQTLPAGTGDPGPVRPSLGSRSHFTLQERTGPGPGEIP